MKEGTFFIVPHTMTDEHLASLSGAAVKVYLVLRRHMHQETGECFPSYPQIMTIAGMSRASVAKGIVELESAQIIQKQKKRGGRTVYQFKKQTTTSSKTRLLPVQKLDGGSSKTRLPPVQKLDSNKTNLTRRINKTKRETVAIAPVARAREHSDTSDAFERFWLRWPSGARKVNKKGAAALWRAKNLDAMAQIVMDGLDRWLASYDWEKNDGEFIPNVTTWLNQDRFYAQPKANGDMTITTNNQHYVTKGEVIEQRTIQGIEDFRRMRKGSSDEPSTLRAGDDRAGGSVRAGRERPAPERLLRPPAKPSR